MGRLRRAHGAGTMTLPSNAKAQDVSSAMTALARTHVHVAPCPVTHRQPPPFGRPAARPSQSRRVPAAWRPCWSTSWWRGQRPEGKGGCSVRGAGHGRWAWVPVTAAPGFNFQLRRYSTAAPAVYTYLNTLEEAVVALAGGVGCAVKGSIGADERVAAGRIEQPADRRHAAVAPAQQCRARGV